MMRKYGYVPCTDDQWTSVPRDRLPAAMEAISLVVHAYTEREEEMINQVPGSTCGGRHLSTERVSYWP